MKRSTYSGHGDTFEDAFDAAAKACLEALPQGHPDQLSTVRVTSMAALYGGFPGYTGQRVVEVDAGENSHTRGLSDAGQKALLALKLEVFPSSILADLMPPVSRPQPHNIGLVLTVSNVGGAAYQGESPDSGVVQFAVLRGRQQLWRYPEVTLAVITPVRIETGQSLSYSATWEMPDAVDHVKRELTAVARFVPSGNMALSKIVVRAVY